MEHPTPPPPSPFPPPPPPCHPPAPPPPHTGGGGKGCLWGCLAAFGIAAFLAFLAAVILIAGCAQVGEKFMGAMASAREESRDDELHGLTEVWVDGYGAKRVARIQINGVIVFGNDRYGMNAGSPDLALAAIRRATRDPDVDGLILEINSPGGGITASDILHNALRGFKMADPPGRPILVIMNDLGASGAYYIACAADEIFAHPTTLTGSIGVIIQTYNINRLAETIGVSDVTVKSGENKDLLNPFRPVDNAQVSALVQPLVDAMHARFLDVVCAGRNLEPGVARPLADGRLFTAQSALENKLIDAIGYRACCESRMEELLGEPAVIFRYESAFRFASLFRHSLFRLQDGGGFGAAFREMMEPPETKFMYLWRP